MNRHARRAAGVRAKHVNLSRAELYAFVDAVVAAVPDDPGWVHIAANQLGRSAVEALFPQVHFGDAWRDDPEDGFPSDWRQNSIHLPEAATRFVHNLPMDITGGASLDNATPDQLALLLSIGVMRKGVCVCHETVDGQRKIYPPAPQ
jgi:hypothetical protein